MEGNLVWTGVASRLGGADRGALGSTEGELVRNGDGGPPGVGVGSQVGDGKGDGRPLGDFDGVVLGSVEGDLVDKEDGAEVLVKVEGNSVGKRDDGLLRDFDGDALGSP